MALSSAGVVVCRVLMLCDKSQMSVGVSVGRGSIVYPCDGECSDVGHELGIGSMWVDDDGVI